MRSIINYLLLLTGMTVFLAACTKVDELPRYEKGNAVELRASVTSIAPAPADSAKSVVDFTWSNPNYATDTSNYKFIVEIDSAGRGFSAPFKKEVKGTRNFSLTGRELNTILVNYGFALGSPHSLEVRVTSSYANNNEQYLSNVVKVNVTPYSDPSKLETTATTVSGTLATASEKALTLIWTPSFPGYAGAVTYVLQYDTAGGSFANAGEIAIGNNILTRDLTKGQVNETALESGIGFEKTGKVDYRIKATTAQGAVAYSNVVSITVNTYTPIIRLYLPGSYQAATGQGDNWTPGNAPEMIRDLRPEVFNQLYYAYIYLPAGAEFKITSGRSWDVNYGGTGGNLVAGSPDNLKVTNAGVYRISVDLKNMKYDIRDGRMGFVGEINGWKPENTFPALQMTYVAPNLFIGVADFPVGGWKMIDNNVWNGGANANTVLETRSYGADGGTGSTMKVNGPNFPSITTAGRYRVIWDGRNPDNIKYEIYPANEMRVVGNGIEGVADWTPGSSPQMTYSGSGVWTISLALKANKEIKFLSGDAWGAFDYEDAGGGKIKWEGGDNFKTPATAGTYTITLNEKTQTYTIN